MRRLTEKDRFDYAWNHFALIADQRVKTFNFYIVVLLAAFGATLSVLKPSTPRHLFILIGLGHILIVVIFAMIESRGRAILAIAKQALRDVENSAFYGDGYKPMTMESSTGRGRWGKRVTYGNAFALTFVAHLLFGLTLALWPSLYHVETKPESSWSVVVSNQRRQADQSSPLSPNPWK